MRSSAVMMTKLLGIFLAMACAGCEVGNVIPHLCSGPGDCPPGQTCSEGACQSISDGAPYAWDLGSGDWPQLTDAGLCAGGGVACGKACCAKGQVCVYGACTAPQPACTGDKDCINDTYCDKGTCVPWGHGPKGSFNKSCTYLIPIGQFSPTRQCAWTGPPTGDKYPKHKNVLGTPTVVDFLFNPTSTARKPSIVFVSYDGEDGGSPASACASGYYGVIRVIDGGTCAQQHTLDMAKVRASSPLAVGDLNLDGRADVVAQRCGGGLVAFSYDATAKKFKLLWTSSPSTTGSNSGGWEGPSLHDLDDDGKPEILMGGTVWNSAGKLVDSSLGMLTYSAGFIPVAADLDGDKLVDLVNGASVWSFTGNKWTLKTSSSNAAGHVAVADLGTYGADPKKDNRGKLDGVAEVVVVSGGTVRAQTLAGRVFYGPMSIPAGGTGGPPTVGDFDKDNRAEIAAAGKDSYSVFDPDCGAAPAKATCNTMTKTGILWTRTSQDHSSSVTGSSVFDFEGDGAAEAIYADECFTRVYDGKSGEVLYSQWRTSCTWYENPIVADVDGDFNSELVVPSNTNCVIDTSCKTNKNHHTHPTSGLTLDPMFKGLRCKKASDCPGGTCNLGYCRCTKDSECGNATSGFVCAPVVPGTAGTGQVCRAAFKGDVGGILVYRDVLDRWVNSRPIWNQHAYAVSNISDLGKVPRTSTWVQNWKIAGLNNFRQNKQGSLDPTSSPDLTAGPNKGKSGVEPKVTFPCDKQGTLTLKINLCNRGTQPVGAGVPVTFYNGPAAGKQKICTATSKGQIYPGKCEVLTCDWKGAPVNKTTDVHVVADDDGTGTGTTNECNELNNRALLKGVRCSTVG